MILPYPDDLGSPIVYFKVGPDEKKYAIHASVLQRHFTWMSGTEGKSLEYIFRITSDVEGIFAQVLQYMYTGDYSIPDPTHDSASVACEAELNTVHLRLRDKYLQGYINTGQFLDKLAWLFSQELRSPVCEEHTYLCKCPDVLLSHARLHIFAKSQGLDKLSCLSLWKLVHALLEQLVAHPAKTEGVVGLLRFVIEQRTADEDLITLLVHYVSSRLKCLVSCPNFAALMQKQPRLTYRILDNVCDFL